MTNVEVDFFDFEPEQFVALDLTAYSEAALREMAYFIWTMYPDDPGLMDWRRQRLLPLVSIDDMIYENEDDED